MDPVRDYIVKNKINMVKLFDVEILIASNRTTEI